MEQLRAHSDQYVSRRKLLIFHTRKGSELDALERLLTERQQGSFTLSELVGKVAAASQYVSGKSGCVNHLNNPGETPPDGTSTSRVLHAIGLLFNREASTKLPTGAYCG